MDMLDSLYWKIRLFLLKRLAQKEDVINKAASRFKKWLDGD